MQKVKITPCYETPLAQATGMTRTFETTDTGALADRTTFPGTSNKPQCASKLEIPKMKLPPGMSEEQVDNKDGKTLAEKIT